MGQEAKEEMKAYHKAGACSYGRFTPCESDWSRPRGVALTSRIWLLRCSHQDRNRMVPTTMKARR